jgi:ATP-binding cassette subfamily B protein
MPVIQVFNAQSSWKNRYYDLAREYLRRTIDQICLFGAFVPLTEFMSSAAIAVLLWYGGGQVIRDQLSLGELVVFLTYMRLFFQPLSELSQKFSIVQSAMASAERIFQLLDARASISESIALNISPAVDGKVGFAQVSFSYDKKKAVLKDLNLVIKSGETVAIVGCTGSGKTTLISLLSRFYDPDHGSIYLDGVNIRYFPVYQLRQMIGVITQDILILPGTVRANITLDRLCDEHKLSVILEQTGVNELISKLPRGLDTIIGDGGLNLSIGEKQLISFVRVLYREPDILVFDEATASIDSETEKMLEKAVTAGIEDKTSIVIAHRLSTIRRANRIAVMNDGCIKEIGTHEELIAKGKIYKQMVELYLYHNDTEKNCDQSMQPHTMTSAKFMKQSNTTATQLHFRRIIRS